MAADIAPELYEKIASEFKNRVDENKKIKNFQSRLIEGTATARDVSLYSAELGECASAALRKDLTRESLPNGRLYWNIAERTIMPLLKEVHKLVMNAAMTVQRKEDETIGLHIKPIESEFPEERVRDLIGKLVEMFKDEE